MMDGPSAHDPMDPATDPFDRFAEWMAEAHAAEPRDANAMTVSSVGPDLRPTARAILLKGVDGPELGARRGFLFYTNLESRKGRELNANPAVCLSFYWKSLGRQIRIEGRCAPVSDAEADAYFASRPRGSRVGAWASDQSRPLASRAALEARIAEAEARFAGMEPPRPPHWSGFRVAPEAIEFWREGEFRLHDRIQYARTALDQPWTVERLYP